MAVGWVDALLDLWRNDATIDFRALENEWRLKPFQTGGGEYTREGGEPTARGKLLCCLTGFDDSMFLLPGCLSPPYSRQTNATKRTSVKALLTKSHPTAEATPVISLAKSLIWSYANPKAENTLLQGLGIYTPSPWSGCSTAPPAA